MTLKRFGYSLVIFVALSAAAIWGFSAYSDWSDHRAQQEKEAQVREDREVRIGDDTITVKRKLGLPSAQSNRGAEIVWLWGDVSGVVLFTKVDETHRAYRILLVSDSLLWIAEDGLSTSTYQPVDSTVRAFQSTYGPPCSIITDDSSTTFFYRLETHAPERAKSPFFPNRLVVRELEVNLANGKSLEHHGWTVLAADGISAGRCRTPRGSR